MSQVRTLALPKPDGMEQLCLNLEAGMQGAWLMETTSKKHLVNAGYPFSGGTL